MAARAGPSSWSLPEWASSFFCGVFVLLWSQKFTYLGGEEALLVTCPSFFVVPSDLTAEERQELENIRRRKQELLADIQVGGAAATPAAV